MRTAFPAQELPVRSALTVGVRCVNRTRRHAASVTVYSVLRACPSIQCSTPKLHQQITEGNKNVKPHNLNSAVRSANTARKQAVLRRQFGRSASLRQRRVGETSENAEHEQIRESSGDGRWEFCDICPATA